MANGVTIEQVYEELKKIETNMITKEEILMLLETVEIMTNTNTMNQINESEEDIKHNRIKKINSVSDI